MLSFRVSEEQYRSLRAICISDGFVSYSELARTAIDELIQNHTRTEAKKVEGEIERLWARVEELNRALKNVNSASALADAR